MIKNKAIDIEIIFKTYLKILKTGKKIILNSQTNFYFTKH